MKRTNLLFIVFAFATAIGMLACNKSNQTDSDTDTQKPTAPKNTVVLSEKAAAHAQISTAVAGPGALQKSLTLQGEIVAVPEKLATIVAKLEGVVIKVNKKEGDKVKAGEAMVTIESKKLAETKLQYIEIEHRLHFAEEALAREKALFDKKITPEETYRKVAHDYEEAKLAHASALQRLKLLGFQEERLHQIAKNPDQKLTSYTLRAPFSGEVIKKDVTLGEAVMEDKELFALADLSELFVEIKVPLSAIGAFAPGVKAAVECDVLSLVTEGEVRHVSSVAEADTRTISVKILIANPEGQWRPGMPARVKMENTKIPVETAVPVDAILEIEGHPAVFVETDKNTYRLTRITLGEKDETLAAIESGISAGDKVADKNSLVLKSEWLKTAGE